MPYLDSAASLCRKHGTAHLVFQRLAVEGKPLRRQALHDGGLLPAAQHALVLCLKVDTRALHTIPNAVNLPTLHTKSLHATYASQMVHPLVQNRPR